MMHQRYFPLLLLLFFLPACDIVGNTPGTPTEEGRPTIVDFSATPVDTQGQATLSWRVSDATSLSLDQGIGEVTGESVVVSPAQSTTYTLTATNDQGSSRAQATVTVGDSPPPTPGEDATAPTGSFGVSATASPPFQNDSGGNITSGEDSRVVRVQPGGSFYMQVAYDDPSGISSVEVNLVNSSPAGIRGALDPSQQFFTLVDPETGQGGSCDLSSTPMSVTCVYEVQVAQDAVNISELDGAGSEFAYVFRTKVTDSAGNTSDEAIRGYVIVTEETDPTPPSEENQAPTAEFTAEQQADSLAVKFSAKPSSDPDGDALSYAWDFGDGSSGASGRDYTKTYPEAGDYQVALTVTDGKGGEDTEIKTVTVEEVDESDPPPSENAAPKVTVEDVGPLTLEQDQDEVTARLEATIEDDSPTEDLRYTWNVTGGEAENVSLATRNEEDTDVSFSAAGSYTLTLTVSDGDKEGEGNVVLVVKEGEEEPEPQPEPGTCTDPVSISDEVLEQVVRDELGLAEDNLVTCEDLTKLTEVDYQNSYDPVVSLEGLQYATNLELLRLSIIEDDQQHFVSDLSPLTGLEKLNTIILINEQIEDLSPLASLSSLETLTLAFDSSDNFEQLAALTTLRSLSLPLNNIADLSFLQNLANLSDLYLGENNISDLTPLRGLNNLQSLNLVRNQVDDLAPLVENESLGEGDTIVLSENPLDTCPGTEDRQAIDTLIERGVGVEFDKPAGCGTNSDGEGATTATLTSGIALLDEEAP